ncbi:MAG: phenylalanine--tRNA ligase beta subunit-related protein, partial [Ignisphaera sp.]
MELCVNLENIVSIASEVKDLGIHIAYTISWAGQINELQFYPFEYDVAKLLEYIKNNFALDNLKEHKVIRAYRDFFWRLGVDPTKIRPANEALVRRALKGSFPRINPIVDAGNIASAFTMIPIGMYDLDKALVPLTIKSSVGGEVFRPIGGKEEV